KMLTYDTKSDSSRVVPGYIWLQGDGAVLLSAAPQDTELLKPRAIADTLPFYSTSAQQSMIHEMSWLVNEYGTGEAQLDVIFARIQSTWTSYPTKPKVGYLSLAGVPFYAAHQVYFDQLAAANPDVIQYLGSQMAPSSTTVWAAEILKFMSCDYIIVDLSGPPLASFLSESRTRGYTGKFQGLQEGLVGFWSLVKASVTPDKLEGSLCTSYWQWWNDGGSFIDAAKTYVQKYHSAGDAANYMLTSGFLTGWIYGTALVDSLRRAADTAGGGDKVTGADLFAALRATNLTLQGLKYPVAETATNNCLLRGVKMLQFSAAVGNFVTITDYEIPTSLAS
ncbi:MAG: hypothetical protein NTU41_14830, partial [Chloroflexi bacterium]|nr:hypothetical protein [Chloroflexota bacterium]